MTDVVPPKLLERVIKMVPLLRVGQPLGTQSISILLILFSQINSQLF